MIYYIYDYSNNAVKIGYTKSERNVWLRYEAIQVANAIPLILLKYEEGSQKDERKKHKEYQHLRIRGEWFFYDRELKDYINTDLDLDFNKLDQIDDDYIHNYHAQKYNRNTKISYLNLYSKASHHIKDKDLKDKVNQYYDTINGFDTCEDVFKELKCYKKNTNTDWETLYEISVNRLQHIFVERENNEIPIIQIRDYFKRHRILNKTGTGTMPVSKLLNYFDVSFVYRKINDKTTRCLVGLDFKFN